MLVNELKKLFRQRWICVHLRNLFEVLFQEVIIKATFDVYVLLLQLVIDLDLILKKLFLDITDWIRILFFLMPTTESFKIIELVNLLIKLLNGSKLFKVLVYWLVPHANFIKDFIRWHRAILGLAVFIILIFNDQMIFLHGSPVCDVPLWTYRIHWLNSTGVYGRLWFKPLISQPLFVTGHFN